MLDTVSLTTFLIPDIDYLKSKSEPVQSHNPKAIYKFMCNVDNMRVFFEPDRFEWQ